ncbi:hypothetical protein T190_13660 [Sinorhizobium meliloti CCBAU 01290]|nr:hypothetical protein T190_13660 [Sinorhizobium meliloti CCBAU 01290]
MFQKVVLQVREIPGVKKSRAVEEFWGGFRAMAPLMWR